MPALSAVGNIEPLLALEAPNCWACEPDVAPCTCDQTTVDNVQVCVQPGSGRTGTRRRPPLARCGLASLSSLLAFSDCFFQNIEISAIIIGMLSFGFVADAIGRKWGSR